MDVTPADPSGNVARGAISPDVVAEQNAGLRRRVEVLEAENAKLRDAVEYTLRTLELYRDPTANPLAKMCDRATAEAKLREAARG